MTRKRSRRWTLIVVREGQVRSRTVELSRGRLAALGLVAGGVLAVTFFGLGRWRGAAAANERIALLEGENEALGIRNERIGAVASRLEGIESEYRQLRRVMGGEVMPSRRDILLPPLAAGEGEVRRIEQTESDPRRFVWPLVEPGFVTRTFGDTTTAPFGGHVGVDIAVPAGSYVRSSRSGVVTEARDDPGYGLYVRVEHEDDVSSLYAHNSWLFVTTGDTVETGEVIALSGNSGRSTAPHLHLEFEQGDTPVDPLGYLADGT